MEERLTATVPYRFPAAAILVALVGLAVGSAIGAAATLLAPRSDRFGPGIVAGGVPLSGLSEAEARDRLAAYARRLRTLPIRLVAGRHEHRTDLASLGGDVRRLGTGGVVKGAARTNLAIVEVWGEAVSVMVRLMDGEGRQLGQRQVELLPLSNVQINDLVSALGGPASLAAGLVTLEVVGGDGRVGAVLSVVDNASNDPTTIPLVPW